MLDKVSVAREDLLVIERSLERLRVDIAKSQANNGTSPRKPSNPFRFDVESVAVPRWGKKSTAPPPAPVSFVLIRITNHPGKYAMRGVKGDLLVAPKAQASEFPSTEAPRRQKELERRGFKTKVEPA
jgi:hypothetical protein